VNYRYGDADGLPGDSPECGLGDLGLPRAEPVNVELKNGRDIPQSRLEVVPFHADNIIYRDVPVGLGGICRPSPRNASQNGQTLIDLHGETSYTSRHVNLSF
jgi:hypothetical protein